jgi:hypothetical protein
MPMFLVTFMALLFWIATWLTIQIVCDPFRRGNTDLRPVRQADILSASACMEAECNSAGRTDLEVYVPRPTWLTSKSERLFSAEAPRIRTGPQLQAAGLRPRN